MTSRPLGAVRVVLFDYGNTIAHLDHAFIADTLSRHGHAVTADDVGRADHTAKRGIDRLVTARRTGTDSERRVSYFGMILETLGADADRVRAVTQALEDTNACESLWRVVLDDTTTVLETLRARGYRLGIISNADGRVPSDLQRNGLHVHFDPVLDSHRVGVEKPDPRIFALALERLGVRPEEAIYVGDVHSIDIEGAEGAGITGILLDRLGLYDGVACRRIRSLAELLALLPDPSPVR